MSDRHKRSSVTPRLHDSTLGLRTPTPSVRQEQDLVVVDAQEEVKGTTGTYHKQYGSAQPSDYFSFLSAFFRRISSVLCAYKTLFIPIYNQQTGQ